MYTGVTGKVTVGGTTLAYISNWSIEDTTEIIEVARLGSPFKHKEAGLQSWSASADGAVEFAANSGHAALFTAKRNGTPVQCEFFLTDGRTSINVPTPNNNQAAVRFVGSGLIESLSVELLAEDKGNIAISIAGIGGLGLHDGIIPIMEQVPAPTAGTN